MTEVLNVDESDRFATYKDLELVESRLLVTIGDVRSDVRALDSKVDALDGKVDAQGESLRGDIKALEGKMSEQGATLRGEIKDVDVKVEKLDAKVDKLDAKVDAITAAITWRLVGWLLAVLLALMAPALRIIALLERIPID